MSKALNLSGKPIQFADKDLRNSSEVPKHNSFKPDKRISKLAFIIVSPSARGKVDSDPSLLCQIEAFSFISAETGSKV